MVWLEKSASFYYMCLVLYMLVLLFVFEIRTGLVLMTFPGVVAKIHNISVLPDRIIKGIVWHKIFIKQYFLVHFFEKN